MQHTYAVFYQTLNGKKAKIETAELNFSPTKIISIQEIQKGIEVLKTKHPEGTEISITGMMYLRSIEE